MNYEVNAMSQYDVIDVVHGVPDFANPIATFATKEEAESFADSLMWQSDRREIGINKRTSK